MIKSVEFRKKRDFLWKRLEELLNKIGPNYNTKKLSPQELEELSKLYRLSVSSLYIARTITLDQNLLNYLQSLVIRGYFCIYGRATRQNTISNFFLQQFPNLVRKYILYHAVAFFLILSGIIAGFFTTCDDPSNFFAFVEEKKTIGRTPFDSKESLAEILKGGRTSSEAEKTLFFSQLFSHNAKIGFISFALGIGLGIPTIFLMVINGGSLGALAAAYHLHKLDGPFWAWILPHGITEFLAIILCAGAGFILAVNLLRPGLYGRLHNLKIAAQDAGLIVMGSVPIFLIAGYIEAFFRQSYLPDIVRYFVALVTVLLWYIYFSKTGTRKEH